MFAGKALFALLIAAWAMPSFAVQGAVTHIHALGPFGTHLPMEFPEHGTG